MKPLKFIATNLFLLFAIFSHSQTIEVDGEEYPFNSLSYGVKAGINYATVSKGNAAISPDGRLGFYAGIFGELPLIDDLLSIQGELVYSQEGFERRQQTSAATFAANYNLDYLNLPILAKYYIVRGFSVEGGPQFSLLLNDEIKTNFSTAERPIPTEIKSFDLRFAAGTSFQFDEGIFINLRYVHGITTAIEETNARNSSIQVGLGYKF